MIDEALGHAVEIMTAEGVGALSISAMARRMQIRPPSLYKYFPSLNGVYDALFARGARSHLDAVSRVAAPRGVERIVEFGAVTVRWSVDNPALAQLLFWRPVPGFEPTSGALAASVDSMALVRAEFEHAARIGQLDPAADSEDLVDLFTVIVSGLVSQQLANQPGVPYEFGRFSSRAETALRNFLAYHRSGGGS